MFEKASRQKIRFNYKGMRTVEDLWDMPVATLDSIYKELTSELKEQSNEGLLKTKNGQQELVGLKLDIVKYIFYTKVQEAEARSAKKEALERNQKIMEIIDQKERNELLNTPLEELKKLIV